MIEIRKNNAREDEIIIYLLENDTKFIPSLSTQVDIEKYAKKIYENAIRIEAWQGNKMIGFVAVYCNTMDRNIAFITSVSVRSEYHGQGIATRLLEECIKNIYNEGYRYAMLEVHCSNKNAIMLYKKIGFKVVSVTGPIKKMNLIINDKSICR